MSDMMEKLAKGLGVGSFLDGVGRSVFGTENTAGTERTPQDTVDDLAGLLGTVVQKITGKEMNISPDMVDTISALVKANVPAMDAAANAKKTPKPDQNK